MPRNPVKNESAKLQYREVYFIGNPDCRHEWHCTGKLKHDGLHDEFRCRKCRARMSEPRYQVQQWGLTPIGAATRDARNRKNKTKYDNTLESRFARLAKFIEG